MADLPRIRYNPTQTAAKTDNITVDFDRHLNAVDVQNVVNGHTAVAQSGKEQQATFYDQDLLRFTAEFANPSVIQGFEEFWTEHAKDGRSFEFWRDRDLVAYVPVKGKVLDTTDRVAATFNRAISTNVNATYHDPSLGINADPIVPLGESGAEGLLNNATAGGAAPDDTDIARFPKGKFGRGILIESGKTQLLTEANRFDAGTGAWTLSNVTVTADTTETKDPAGFNAADKAEATAANGTLTETTATAIGSDFGVFSVWARTRQGTSSGRLLINSTTAGQLSTDTILVTDEWQRFVGVSTVASPGGNWEVVIEIDNSGDFWYLYGAQLEVGTDIEFASSNLLTQGSTAVRSADSLEYSLAEIGQVTGTVMFWFKPLWAFDAHPNATLFVIGSTLRHCSLTVLSTGNLEVRMDMHNSSTQGQGNSVSMSGILTQHTWHHFAVTYDAGNGSSLKAYVDGVLRTTSTQDAFIPNPTDSEFHLGENQSGAAQADGVFDDVVIRSDVLTASEILQVYNNGVAGIPYGQGRNYYSSVKAAQNVFSPIEISGTTRATLDFPMKEVL